MDKNYRERRNTEDTITNFLNGKHIKDTFYMEELKGSFKKIYPEDFCKKAEEYLKEMKEFIESETQLKVHFTVNPEDDYIILNAEKANWHYRNKTHFGEFYLIAQKYSPIFMARGIANEMVDAYLHDTFLRRKTHE